MHTLVAWNRKGLLVTKSLEASPALNKVEVGGLKGPQECFRNTKQVLGNFATRGIVGFGGTSLAHELFINTYVGHRRSSCTGIII
jgi:hypothetical protein